MQDLRPPGTHPFPKPCSQYNTGNLHACTPTIRCGDKIVPEMMLPMVRGVDMINRNESLSFRFGRDAILILIAHLGNHICRSIKIRIHVLNIIMFFERFDQLDHLLGLPVLKENVILR